MVANANASDKNLAGTSTKLANGTYTDEVTGSTITVSGGKVTSGTVKGQSIAAFSNKTRSGKVSTAEAYPNKGTIPGESKTVTLRVLPVHQHHLFHFRRSIRFLQGRRHH